MSASRKVEVVRAISEGDVAEPAMPDLPKEHVEATEPEGDAVMDRVGDEQWVLLWSRGQGALHKMPLVDAMAAGLAMLKGELEANDDTLLYVGSRNDVDARAIELSPRVDAHAQADEVLGLRDKPV